MRTFGTPGRDMRPVPSYDAGIEEASVAGESPDKSEQRKSSGEAAGGERDPRLGVFRETGVDGPRNDQGTTAAGKAGSAGSAGSAGEARTAVATRGADTDGASGADDVDGAGDASGAGAAADVSGKDAGAAADADAGANSAKDERGSGGAPSGKAGVPAGGDARLKAAVAAWVASAEEEAPAGDEGSSSGARSSSGAGESGDRAASGDRPAAKPQRAADDGAAGSGDQPTAVFAAPVKPAAKDGADAGSSGNAAAPKAADRPTAVFGAVAANGSGKAGFGTAKSVADKPGADEPEAGKPRWAASAEKPAAAGADQPTAVIGKAEVDAAKDAAGKGAGQAAGKGTASADQPTELIKAPVVEPERKSQFVPLKTDDAPAKPAAPAKPSLAKPAAPKPAGGTDAGSAAKPAVPVSVAPPAPAAPPAAGPNGERPAPLDLLAQLTNTPPPPETPVRTVVRRVKIWTPIAALLAIVFCVVQAFRPLPDARLKLDKAAEFTFGGEKFQMKWPEEGQSAAKVVGVGSLGTFGDQTPTPTASMAKAMTAYVILRDHPLKMKKANGQDAPEPGEMISVDAKAEQEGKAEGESTVHVKAGQKYSEYDMLQMLLIPSGNNIARLLARWDAQSEDAFAQKMNAAAKELGMKNTNYTDPSGLNKTTVSTAADQVRLAEPLIKNPVIRTITTKPNAQIGDIRLENSISDLLLKHTGVLGIKTGSSSAAGGTLMWVARKRFGDQEVLIVGATMAQHFKGLDPDALNSLKKVKDVSYPQMTAVQNALEQATVVKQGQVVGYLDDQLGGKVPVVATKEVKAVGWGGMKARFSLHAIKGKALPHSAKAGTVVGELEIGTGEDAVKVPVALQKAATEPGFGAKLTRLG
ncbi:D-alanyl-D-alanine carboxypeptidase [Streptomyces orinoci]|uniref:D-alanyl-D-alanine carboxypeptidase n=1 Tax=Streptomyces orinoci TaxID=67339 RepID=A0ABV3JY91_STRON|nr:D-alanyl-D-alanine carboxypeptidase [Streptomyces orinoci]